MKNITLSEYLEQDRSPIITVNLDDSLEQIVEQVITHPVVNDIYVLDRNLRPVGHISKLRLGRIFLAEHRLTISRRQLLERVVGGSASEIMSASFPTAHVDEYLIDIIHKQIEHGLIDMAVVDNDGKFIATISLNNILKYYID